MKRPVFTPARKKFMLYARIIMLVLLALVMFDVLPVTFMWVWFALFAVIMAVLVYDGFRQGCRVYSWVCIAGIAVTGALIWVALSVM